MSGCPGQGAPSAQGTLTTHITGAVLAHDACVVLFVRWPLVDEHGCVGRAGVQNDAILGVGGRSASGGAGA